MAQSGQRKAIIMRSPLASTGKMPQNYTAANSPNTAHARPPHTIPFKKPSIKEAPKRCRSACIKAINILADVFLTDFGKSFLESFEVRFAPSLQADLILPGPPISWAFLVVRSCSFSAGTQISLHFSLTKISRALSHGESSKILHRFFFCVYLACLLRSVAACLLGRQLETLSERSLLGAVQRLDKMVTMFEHAVVICICPSFDGLWRLQGHLSEAG